MRPPSAVGRRSIWATSLRAKRAPARCWRGSSRLLRKPWLPMLPFASAGWRDGNSVVRYRMTTFLPGAPDAEDTEARTWLPGLSARDGKLAIEHGLHQELGWERRTDQSGVAVVVFTDRIDNPVIESMSHFAAGNSTSASVLLDPSSGLLHAAGPRFSTTGVEAVFGHRLPRGNHLSLSYASGNALVLAAVPSFAAGRIPGPGAGQRPAPPRTDVCVIALRHH
jgi:hypothetical protein